MCSEPCNEMGREVDGATVDTDSILGTDGEVRETLAKYRDDSVEERV